MEDFELEALSVREGQRSLLLTGLRSRADPSLLEVCSPNHPAMAFGSPQGPFRRPLRLGCLSYMPTPTFCVGTLLRVGLWLPQAHGVLYMHMCCVCSFPFANLSPSNLFDCEGCRKPPEAEENSSLPSVLLLQGQGWELTGRLYHTAQEKTLYQHVRLQSSGDNFCDLTIT